MPVFPNTVMLSPTLNGLVLAKYNPAIRFPMSDCEANPITSPVIVVIEAATRGSLLRYEIMIAAIIIALAILINILIECAVSPEIGGCYTEYQVAYYFHKEITHDHNLCNFYERQCP